MSNDNPFGENVPLLTSVIKTRDQSIPLLMDTQSETFNFYDGNSKRRRLMGICGSCLKYCMTVLKKIFIYLLLLTILAMNCFIIYTLNEMGKQQKEFAKAFHKWFPFIFKDI